MPPDYLAIGHVTADVWRDGRSTPGGTAWFSALAARRMVENVSVLTAAGEDYDVARHLPGIRAYRLASPTTTQFENIYTPAGRIQYAAQPDAFDAGPSHGRASPEPNRALSAGLRRSQPRFC